MAAATSGGGPAKALEGAGSIWNPGSWHWESKNYNKWAEETVRARLKSIGVSSTSGVPPLTVNVVDVPELKAEATVNIRKGKRIPVYDFTFTLKWEGRASDGSSSRIASGDAKVMDVMPDDIDDDFEVRVSLNASGGDIDARARDLMKTQGAAAVRKHMREFAAQLIEHDGGQEKLALDAKRRAEEAAKTVAAREETGAEKERIAKEMAAKEAARKAEEAARAAAMAAAAGGAGSSEPKKVEAAAGTGSVWNVNSYHWEEKPLTPWAKERLTQLLKGFDVDIPGGSVKIDSVDLIGEASTSIRKGKKLVFFEFKIKCEWSGQLVDDEGEMLGSGDGEIEIPEVDQDSGDDFEVKVKESDDGDHKDRKLRDLLKAHGVSIIKDKIKQFVTELKAKG